MQGTSTHPSRRARRGLAVAALLGGLLASAAPAAAAPTWLAPSTLSEAGQPAAAPQVVIDSTGTATAIWYRNDGAKNRVQTATRPAGGTWQTPVTLSDAGQDAYAPQIALDAAGNATAIWLRNDGINYRVQVATRPAGGTWQAQGTISDAGHNASGVQIAVNAAGAATAVWVRSDGTNSRIEAAARPAGSGWQAPSTISDAGQDADLPGVTLDAAGNATAVWYRYDSAQYRVQAATRPAGGSWLPPVTLSALGQSAFDPQVRTDAAGNATAIWVRSNGRHYLVQAATRTVGGTWQPPVTLSDAGQSASSPQIALDAAGNAAAAWQRSDGTNDRIQIVTRPVGGTWQAPIPVSEAGQDASTPQIAVDSASNIAAIWYRSDGANNRVQAATRPAGGSWQQPVTLSEAGRPAYSVQLAFDPAGNATAVWQRYDGSSDRIQAAGLDAAGPNISGVSVPATGVAGLPVTVTAAPTDVWSAIAGTSWTFGDGGSAASATASHTYKKPGTYTVTVTATDAVGNASSATRQIAVALAPLTVSGKTATFNATLALKKSAKKCPNAKTLAIALRGKKALVIKKRKLNKVTKTSAGCLLTGTVTLKKSAKAGTKVTAKIAGKGLKTSTLSAVAG